MNPVTQEWVDKAEEDFHVPACHRDRGSNVPPGNRNSPHDRNTVIGKLAILGDHREAA